MKTLNKFLCFIISGLICIACFPFYFVPVYADTESYYSYGNYLANDTGTTIYGVNLNVSKVNAIIANKNTGTEQNYQVVYFVYAYAEIESDAWSSLNSSLGGSSSYADTTLFKGIDTSNTNGNWVNGSAITSSSSRKIYSYSGKQYYIVYYYITINPNKSWALSCYGKKGTPVVSSTSTVNGAGYYPGVYLKHMLTGELENNFTIGSWLGGWVSDSSAITPVFTPDSSGDEGDIDNLPTPETTPTPSSDPSITPSPSSDPSGSGSLYQQQQLLVQEGAFAFTVEEGAIQNSNTIEENAVNVTVNNNNSLNNENIQNLNNLINNVVDTGSQNAINEGINAITGFTSIARSFSGLMAAVLGFLPGWVTTLLALLFVLLFVMIVFRLIHLFI